MLDAILSLRCIKIGGRIIKIRTIFRALLVIIGAIFVVCAINDSDTEQIQLDFSVKYID